MAQRKKKTTKKSATAKRRAGTKLFLVLPCQNVGFDGLKRQGTVFSAKLDAVAHLVAGRSIVEVASFDDARTTYRDAATKMFRKEFNISSKADMVYEHTVGKQYGDVAGGPDSVQDAPAADDDEGDDEG